MKKRCPLACGYCKEIDDLRKKHGVWTAYMSSCTESWFYKAVFRHAWNNACQQKYKTTYLFFLLKILLQHAFFFVLLGDEFSPLLQFSVLLVRMIQNIFPTRQQFAFHSFQFRFKFLLLLVSLIYTNMKTTFSHYAGCSPGKWDFVSFLIILVKSAHLLHLFLLFLDFFKHFLSLFSDNAFIVFDLVLFFLQFCFLLRRKFFLLLKRNMKEGEMIFFTDTPSVWNKKQFKTSNFFFHKDHSRHRTGSRPRFHRRHLLRFLLFLSSSFSSFLLSSSDLLWA